MDSLAYIAPWVFGSVCVGIVVGFYVGRGRSHNDQDFKITQVEREATLKVLVALLKTAEQMTSDVELHNSEIQQTADSVGRIQVTEQMEGVKETLLGQIAALLTSNHRLQEDLTCSRYCIEEQAQQIDKAQREARTDSLTGVANRKAFDEKLHLLHTDWERHRRPYVLILADLDQFKRINDSHGHQAGDRVLEKIGAGMKQWVRKNDFVARYGGDEFVVLLPNTKLEAGLDLAEILRARAADATSRIAVRGEQVSVSLSLGVAAPLEGDSLDSVMHRADQALYKSKRLGRNQVHAQELEPEELPV